MSEEEIRIELAKLDEVIRSLTPEQLIEHTRKMQARAEAGAQMLGLQECFDFLRISVKYLIFDLEATRRDNQYLRRMINELESED